MKLNLEIEIDWIDEEDNLDDAIKRQIINQIVNKVQTQISTQVEEEAEKKINEQVIEKIDSLVQGVFDGFMDKEVMISDKYGDNIKSYENVTAIIKEKFDNFMTQKVDDRGNTDNSSYGSKTTRLSYIIDKQLKDFAEKFTTDAVKQVSAEIKEHVKEGLTTKLGAELMNVLKVDKMLKISD